MNTARLAKSYVILNLFCLSNAFASDSFYQMLRTHGERDAKSIGDMRGKTIDADRAAEIKAINENAVIVPYKPFTSSNSDKSRNEIEDEDDKEEVIPPSPLKPGTPQKINTKASRIQAYENTPTKTVDVNKDNIPDELYFPEEETPAPNKLKSK